MSSLEEHFHYSDDNYLSYRLYEHYAQHTNTLVFTYTHTHPPNQNKTTCESLQQDQGFHINKAILTTKLFMPNKVQS